MFGEIAAIMNTVHLVACVGQKTPNRRPAKDLYTSPWFLKARRYVEAQGTPWFILSAKRGLLHPDQPTSPYELTLNGIGVVERRAWALQVLEALLPQLDRESTVTFLAGQRYREHLTPVLEAAGVKVQVPMSGLAIGQQLAWLDANSLPSGRPADLKRFYEIMASLKSRLGGFKKLADGRALLPRNSSGVYFFFDDSEPRSGSGNGPRVVRVGTHGVSKGTKSTLWSRLAQHRGAARIGGGNHRGSVFRKLVGMSLIRRDGLDYPNWGQGSSGTKNVKLSESPLEIKVSECLRELPYLWIRIEDAAGPSSDRAFIERNTIALLSERNKTSVDVASADWLGQFSDKEKVRTSGLWNSNHVDEDYDSQFLSKLAAYADATSTSP